MTPTEKDAMALAVLDADSPYATNCPIDWAADLAKARAHLASRIADQAEEIRALKAEVKGLTKSLTDAIDQHEDAKVDAKFIREAYFKAEAELAAVRANAERYLHLREANNADPTPFIAQRYEHGIMQWTGEEADAAVDAARGGE